MDMKHIVIGTAGHVDHGKTCLTKALTGVDTDRLKEEQKRGITIELGFTWFDMKDGTRCGIIDVPGHEKFVGNMVSGVVGMDLVIMVVALRVSLVIALAQYGGRALGCKGRATLSRPCRAA